jgi:hypothetical protein
LFPAFLCFEYRLRMNLLTTGLLLSCLASLVLGLEPPLEELAEENGFRPPRPGGLITKFNSVLRVHCKKRREKKYQPVSNTDV